LSARKVRILGGLDGGEQRKNATGKNMTDSVDVVGRWEERRGPRGGGSGGGGGAKGDPRPVAIPPPIASQGFQS
jgi:hypothetical protein